MCTICYAAFEVNASANIDAAKALLTDLGVSGLTLYGTPSEKQIKFLYHSLDLPKVEKQLGTPEIQKSERTYAYKNLGTIVINTAHRTVAVLDSKPHAPKVTGDEPNVSGLPLDIVADYETAAKNKNANACKQVMLKAWRHFNKKLFGNKLIRPVFGLIPITESSITFGVRGLWWPVSQKLELSPRVFNAGIQVFVEVLLHEMCHEAVTQIDKHHETENKGHGPHWTAWMNRIGQTPSQYDMNDNTVYMSKTERSDFDEKAASGLKHLTRIEYPMPVTAVIDGVQVSGLLVGLVSPNNKRWDFIPDPPTLDASGKLAGWKSVTLDTVYQYIGDKPEAHYHKDSNWNEWRRQVQTLRHRQLIGASILILNEGQIMENTEQMNALKALISNFLALNPNPKDEQVHALAAALGCSHEALEEVMYKMLSHTVTADSQEITEGLVDPEMTTLPDLAANDGDPSSDDVGYQNVTRDDGAAIEDEGLGMSLTDQDILSDDGVAAPPSAGV